VKKFLFKIFQWGLWLWNIKKPVSDVTFTIRGFACVALLHPQNLLVEKRQTNIKFADVVSTWKQQISIAGLLIQANLIFFEKCFNTTFYVRPECIINILRNSNPPNCTCLNWGLLTVRTMLFLKPIGSQYLLKCRIFSTDKLIAVPCVSYHQCIMI